MTTTTTATAATGTGMATGTLVDQPPFATQLTTLPNPLGSNGISGLQRGYMIWDQPQTSLYGANGGPLGDGRAVINFQFNPGSVTSDYNVSNASLQAAMLYSVPGDTGNLLSPMLYQTVSWQLYFDRTFELLYGGTATSVWDPGAIGVQADILAFMQFTGLLATAGGGNAVTGNTTTGAATVASSATGIMMMIPSWVFFGNASQQFAISGNTNVNNNAINAQQAYFGFVSEFTPTYTHWTVNMIPIRASVDVTFTMLPLTAGQTEAATWMEIQQLNGAPTTNTPALGAPNPTGFPGINNVAAGG